MSRDAGGAPAGGQPAPDSQPLLEGTESGLLQRLLSQQRGVWRRLLSGGRSTEPAQPQPSGHADDVETGTLQQPQQQPQPPPATHHPLHSSLVAAEAGREASRGDGDSHVVSAADHVAAETRALLAEAPAERSVTPEITAAPAPDPAAPPRLTDATAAHPASAPASHGGPLFSQDSQDGTESPSRPPAGHSRSFSDLVLEESKDLAEGARGVLKRLMGGGGGSGRKEAGGQLSRSSSGSQPVCLICLDPLTTEDFLSGEAITLDCSCRGEVALRHRACAVKWLRVKGDNVCDICKAPVRNLPAPSPRAPAEGGDPEAPFEEYGADALPGFPGGEAMPGSADMVFDCIRVTWVAMIICILFFEMNLSSALWTGVIVGVGYTLFVRAMYRQQIAAALEEQRRVQGAMQASHGASDAQTTDAAAAAQAAPQPSPQPLHVVVV